MRCLSEISPRARTDRLVIRELDNELLIYDLETHQATCLNAAAGQIWRHCDGHRTINDIVKAFKSFQTSQDDAGHCEKPNPASQNQEFRVEGKAAEGLVLAVLDDLGNAKLLLDYNMPESSTDQSRRRLLRALIASAASIPMVTSITVPTAAQISSCGGVKNDPCNSNADCCPGFYCQTPPGKCRAN